MENFTPIGSTIGGMLIGLSAALVLLLQGRIAGVSQILGGVLQPRNAETGWRAAFLLGLVSGGGLLVLTLPDALANTVTRSPMALIVTGLLVGVGTQLGSGCTSGHGVCGMSRLSKRSIVATCVFMFTGALSAFVIGHLLGGAV